jgi:hypothetical protein
MDLKAEIDTINEIRLKSALLFPSEGDNSTETIQKDILVDGQADERVLIGKGVEPAWLVESRANIEAAQPWEEHSDDEGRKYYYNRVNQTTQWDKPEQDIVLSISTTRDDSAKSDLEASLARTKQHNPDQKRDCVQLLDGSTLLVDTPADAGFLEPKLISLAVNVSSDETIAHQNNDDGMSSKEEAGITRQFYSENLIDQKSSVLDSIKNFNLSSLKTRNKEKANIAELKRVRSFKTAFSFCRMLYLFLFSVQSRN